MNVRYVSIDIETTGLNPETDLILEFAAVIDDLANPRPYEELPNFRQVVLHQRLQGSPYALMLNTDLIREMQNCLATLGESLAPSVEACWPKDLGFRFTNFLLSHKYTTPVIAAGKNFAKFDLQFLQRLPGMPVFHHRSLDPMMLYLSRHDDAPPSMDECKKRAGLISNVKHQALADALDVVQLIRRATW